MQDTQSSQSSEEPERLSSLPTMQSLRTWHNTLAGRDRLLWQFGWISLGVGVCCVLLWCFDPRQVTGINVWIKPFKFATSLWVYAWTLGWLMDTFRWHRVERQVIRWSVIVVMCIELGAICMQAARGTTSHFNNTTAFDGLVFNLMGIAIFWNTLVAGYVCIITFLPQRWRVSKPSLYQWGVRWGFVVFLIGSTVGGLSASMLRHSIGVPDGGPGLPFLNWSTQGGDLRVAHFFGIHALQLIPLVGWWLSRRTQTTTSIHLFSALYLSTVLFLLWQALRGLPFFTM
ncbi:MAG TPA: hypothetical protein DCE42_07295 [Myxococcales bacterium]|nr:hypothetical protein [Deltaproteobacteria bacterium]HAA54545.1 hypothetical protein [Myxococcales bacterium]